MSMKAFPELANAARRPLPEPGEELVALDERDRARLATAWERRAIAELDAASAFATMFHGIVVLDVDPEIRWLAARAACDEIRHAEICRHLALCYAGARGSAVATAVRLAPPRRVASAAAGPVVHAIANCAISETVATAFLSRALDDARGELARAAVRELLEDEVDHARIGWALLAAMDAPERARVGAMTGELVRVVRQVWLEAAAATGDDLPPGHGCLRAAELLAVVDGALRELVIPGLSHVGIDPTGALEAIEATPARTSAARRGGE